MTLTIRDLPTSSYETTWQAMKTAIQAKACHQDQIWLLEHFPVFTQGVTGKAEHLLKPSAIPVIQSDRGGQITYHGPGQLVVYTLLDLKRLQLGVRHFVQQLEQTVIACLKAFSIQSRTIDGMPGVFVGQRKIGSIGLRVRHGICYHGLALNVNMDLTPFSNINPCGYRHITPCQISDFISPPSMSAVKAQFCRDFTQQFGYTHSSSIAAMER